MNIHGFGCHPDGPNDRGSHSFMSVCRLASKWIGLSNQTISWKSRCDSPVDQEKTETCFAHSWVNAVTQAMRSKGFAFEKPSALVLSDMAKGVAGTRGLDVGCSLGATEFAFRTAGFVRESVSPWRPSEVCREIWADEYQDAILQIGTRSHRILQDVRSSIELALSAGCGLVAGMDVDQSFCDCEGETWEGMTGPRLGGHAMSICGCSDYGVEYVGSYGKSWARQGFIWVPWSYIESGHCMSVWAVDAAPEYWREA